MGKKHTSKTRKLLDQAFHEVHHNSPNAVTRTYAKKGEVRAEKQRVAIALSKARAKGARIPKGK